MEVLCPTWESGESWDPCQPDFESHTCLPSAQSIVNGSRNGINLYNQSSHTLYQKTFPESPLPAWAEALKNYHKEEVALFFLRGIAHGFRIGFIPGSIRLKPARQNLEGALSHPQIVEDYLKEEVRLGRVVGPLSPSIQTNCQINRFGVMPKRHQPNNWRLIVDLSFPKDHSINNGIPKHLCSLKYISIDDAVQEILSQGRGAMLAKVDVKSAFRLMPVHPSDRHLLGMSWDNAVYIYTCLLFGLRSAPKLFNLLANLLGWIVEQKGVKTLHYLDDFLLVGPPASNQCEKKPRGSQIYVQVAWNTIGN